MHPPEHAETAEVIVEAARIRQEEKEDAPQRRDKSDNQTTPAGIAAQMRALADDEGLPLAKLPEWDHISGVMRQEWVTVLDYQVKPAPSSSIDETLLKYASVEARIARLVGAAKVSRPERMRRQRQGDRLDYDACIAATIERRLGQNPESGIYETRVMRARDLSVLLLLDISESTRDRVRDTNTTVLALERAAAALLGEAMAGLGDPFAIHAFCSNGREDVRYYRVKDFAEPYGARDPGTACGPARHAVDTAGRSPAAGRGGSLPRAYPSPAGAGGHRWRTVRRRCRGPELSRRGLPQGRPATVASGRGRLLRRP